MKPGELIAFSESGCSSMPDPQTCLMIVRAKNEAMRADNYRNWIRWALPFAALGFGIGYTVARRRRR